jgi:hypothetical protein
MEAFECTGLWWLPGQEADRVSGTLKVSSSGNLHLSLVGALGPVSPAGSKVHQIILGSVDKSPSGNDVTLAGCMLTGSTFGSFAGMRERYHASRGFFGAHLPDKAAFAFKQATVRIGGLTEWAHILSGIVVERQAHHVGEKVPLASYTAHAPISGEVPGGKILLSVGIGSRQSSRELIFREEGSLSVACGTPKSAEEINGEYIYPLQNLVTFVCDRAQEVESFSVWQASATGTPGENPEIKVIGPRVQPDDDGEGREPVQGFQMLFTLEDIDFTDFVERWLRLTDRYSDACNIYFGLKYGPPAYLDMTFMGIAQVLYLYHSRRDDGLARRTEEERRLKEIVAALTQADAEWVIDHVGARPHPTFEGVLRELVGQHSAVMDPLMSNRQDRFINQVMNTLYYAIHREPEVGLAASHGAELYWMMEKLRFLIKACFLSELGFSEQKTLSLFERNALYQHVRQLEAVRESRRVASS